MLLLLEPAVHTGGMDCSLIHYTGHCTLGGCCSKSAAAVHEAGPHLSGEIPA